jgi:Cof subfamily protein (haloacid dehalogenase superfamily)
MRNLLFFDIDGTLITEDERKVFPADAKAALQAARLAGNLIFINTGRVRCNVDPILKETEFDGMVCGCGSYIEYHGEVLYHSTVSKELCHRLAMVCRECNMQAFFEHAEISGYDPEVKLPYIRPLAEELKTSGKPYLSDILAEDFRFDKFSGWYDETSDTERFRKEIQGSFRYIDRGVGFFEVEQEGHSKATGMQFLLEYFDLPFSSSYAFGDSNNDAAMLQTAGVAVVMDNAYESVKEMADVIAPSNEEDGVAAVIEQMLE